MDLKHKNKKNLLKDKNLTSDNLLHANRGIPIIQGPDRRPDYICSFAKAADSES